MTVIDFFLSKPSVPIIILSLDTCLDISRSIFMLHFVNQSYGRGIYRRLKCAEKWSSSFLAVSVICMCCVFVRFVFDPFCFLCSDLLDVCLRCWLPSFFVWSYRCLCLRGSVYNEFVADVSGTFVLHSSKVTPSVMFLDLSRSMMNSSSMGPA